MLSIALPVLSVALLLGAHPGEPFLDLGFEAALEQAKKTEKLLLVDFTASWCAPCKKMDHDTWGDSGVRAWLAEHALAIQVDVDREKELAKRFGIEAMPTVVVFRSGEEFDRITGYRDAAAFLGWTRDVLAGKRTTDELMERARALADSEDLDARMDLAEDLLRAKQYDAALEHYLWLWPATRKSVAMRGVRVSFMLGDMADLARKHEPARKAFLEILEELQKKVDGAEVPTLDDWVEWKAICENFGEEARVFAWYEKRRDEKGLLFGGEPADLVQGLITEGISELLMEKGRPLDAVRLVRDGRRRAERIVGRYQMLTVLSAEHAEQTAAFSRDKLRTDLSQLHAALLLADRREEAADVAALLLKTLDDAESRLALVRAGIDIVQHREASFATWLDEAEAAGANVRITRKRYEKLDPAPEKTPPPQDDED